MSCHLMPFINLVLTFPKQDGGGGAAARSLPHPHHELLVAHIHTQQSGGGDGGPGLWPDFALLFQHL